MQNPARAIAARLSHERNRLAMERSRLTYVAVGELVRRYQGAAAALPEVGADLTPYEYRVFSQNGEDGVIAELVRRVGAPGRTFAEFGAGFGVEANCVFLADVLGWSGLFIEPGKRAYAALSGKYEFNERVSLLREFVTPDNVEALFARAGLPEEPDVVSVDIDGNDYWVWKALAAYRPRIVVIEYNSALEPDRRLVQRFDPEPGVHGGTDDFGASLGALRELGEEKGYRLVHTEMAGVNAFFVRSDLPADPALPESVPTRGPNFWLTGRGPKPASPRQRVFDLDE